MEFSPSVTDTENEYVVSVEINGGVPVRVPLDEFIDIHSGLSDEEYVSDEFSGSLEESTIENGRFSVNTPRLPLAVLQTGV